MHMTRNWRSIIFIALTAGLGILSTIPFAAADVEALDMLTDVDGYILVADLYTYSEDVAMLDEVGVAPATSYSARSR